MSDLHQAQVGDLYRESRSQILQMQDATRAAIEGLHLGSPAFAIERLRTARTRAELALDSLEQLAALWTERR